MDWEGIIVAISLLCGLGLLISDKVSAEVVFITQLIFFWNLNIINSDEALIGFSNKGLISIGALYIIVHPLSSNKYLNNLFGNVLNGHIKLSMLKVCILVAILSAFLNNTPLVQLLTPIIRKYSRINHFPSSRFLMPISFSSIIGGLLTLIGTSTNIIIVSLLPENPVGFFDTALIALPFLGLYLLYNYFLNERLLPIRSGLFREIKNHFFINIRPNSKINIEDIIEDFGIDKSDIIGIYNKENDIIAFNNINQLGDNEYICIKSHPEQIQNILVDKNYKIKDCPVEEIQKNHNIFYECVVGNITNMNKTSFEHKYNCKILASRQTTFEIHRGSTLLLLTSEDFYKLWKNSGDFYMISMFNMEEMNEKKMPIIIFFAMIVLTATNILPIEKSSLSAVVLYIIFRIIDIKDALNVVNYGLLLVIGCSFGISTAMRNSGITGEIAGIITKVGGNWWSIFIITQLIAQILTEVISNNAVAALMTQIVVDICNENGFALKPFVIGLMVSCSSSFITPYGYATNLIIQGTGGYKFLDYLRYGIFVKLLGFMVALLVYFFY